MPSRSVLASGWFMMMSEAAQPDESPASPAFEQNAEKPEQAAPVPAPATDAAAAGSIEDAFIAGNLTGRTIAGYLVEKQAGGGAMATVYQARDVKSGRLVALKILNPGADGTTRERFRREAITAVTLEHPNIVRGFQVGQVSDNGMFYIAMELVTGSSLADLLEQRVRLTPHDACALLEPIARALDFAHERGIVHRDVKPSNILLQEPTDEHPQPVRVGALDAPVVPLLSDFGIARAMDAPELTSAGRTIGTPAFMSPEQCAGDEEIDGRADIYSLGAVLYRCLVGRTPFVGSTTQILHAHVYDPLLIPTEVLESLPEAAVVVLRRSLMKEPADRYQTASEMAEDLAALVRITDDTPAEEADATLTMASLPVADGIRTTSAQILVPARPVSRPAIPATEGVRPVVKRREPTPASLPAARPAAPSTRPNRLGIALLGAALVALTAMLAITLLSGVLPFLGSDGDGATAAATATPPPVAAAAQGSPAARETAAVGAPQTRPVETATAAAESGAAAEPAALPPLEASLDYAWDTAQAFFGERDWGEAVTWLVAVQRIDPEFEKDTVVAMLAEAFMGQAAIAIEEDRLEDAQANLEKATELLPELAVVATLRDAVNGLAEAEPAEEQAALRTLRLAYLDYARALADGGRVCEAAVQAEYAYDLLADAQALEAYNRYAAACAEEQRRDTLAVMTGSLLVSTFEDNRYRIFRVTIGPESQSQLLIDNGSQQALDPSGRIIAFFSLRPDMQGLGGFDITAGLDPNERSLRYTEYVEDSRDGPPGWNPMGNRLAFGSTRFGDGRSRVYLTWADGNGNTTELGLGKDPAWHPTQDLIVMNGTDESGGAPGLWLIRPDGSGRTRLTDNGNDQRPTWTPDGRSVVFMSNGRDDNWDVYRVDLDSLAVTRLTWHTAQDGLPAVSPDGRYVAFMSDRDGYWRLWFVPIEGGEAQPLADIPGELPKWLEHSVQWVR